MMRVKDFMTTPVHTVGPDTPAWEAMGLMRRLQIRRLPVVEGDTLVGIVTWTDLIRSQPPAVGGRRYVPNLFVAVVVRHLMTSNPITVGPDAPLIEAARLMRTHKIGGLPVVEAGRVIGIITESDIFDAFLKAFETGQERIPESRPREGAAAGVQ